MNKPKDLVVPGGSWWRFSKYEVVDGYVRPAAGATLVAYEPWAYFDSKAAATSAPYAFLLELAHRSPGVFITSRTSTEVEVSPVQRREIAEWCGKYGLLGVLPHRASLLRSAEIWGGQTPVERQVQALPADAARFFPGLTVNATTEAEFPTQGSPGFWSTYAEPLDEFIAGAKDLLAAAVGTSDQQGNAPFDFEPLISGVRPLPVARDGRLHLEWRSPSLLGTLAMMMLFTYAAGGRLIRCAKCDCPFVSKGRQTRFCSVKCRRVVHVREHRARKKQKELEEQGKRRRRRGGTT